MSAIVIWRPEPMNARLAAAAPLARQELVRAAQMRAPGKIKVQVLGEAVGSLQPEAIYVEQGTKPHTVEPKGRVLRLADGRYVTGPVKHPGQKAQPFLRPILPLWAPAYRRRAAGMLRGF